MQAPSQQVFKDHPKQNFIELRFAKKNINELSKDEALIRYKKNAYILGRIFSFTPDDNVKDEDSKKQQKYDENLDEKVVEEFQNRFFEMKDLHVQNLKQFQEQQKEFKKLIHDCLHLSGEDQIFQKLQELKQKNLYIEDHPFFKEETEFYLRTDEDERIRENIYQNVSEPLFNENEEAPVILKL
ncbi:hypothetical protein PPERSA_02665 [Pseudocohnilembus persalinus]|uniref:Uncharacterized protein n=1 Tax=Pseudocohnilembus persalinus TaxID=266149 RepID=A0A0V0R5L5_PSEPJ|nr:hypothetical protein PPERSA_02665 [Pseudocohnilembus persalinus]|eukprot:KRX09793.1 hypothetical protein PPERSA_02665 [Pseudocohnilembus persalinus]